MRRRTEPQRCGHKEETAHLHTISALYRSFWSPALSVSGPGAASWSRSPALSVSGSGALPALSVSGPAPQIRVSPAPQAPSSDPRPRGPPAPIRVPPIRSAGPQLRSACHHPARRVPFFLERTPNLTVWGMNPFQKPCSIYSRMAIQPHIHTCAHTYIHTHTYIPTYHLPTYMHTYIHTYIHTYMHTCIHM